MKRFLLFIFLIQTSFLLAQTGKITGTVTDAATNEPLIGANVILQGTSTGAASNLDGYYVILNVSPGTYTMKVSMIGYKATIITEVRVSIDQTTNIDAKLSEASIETEEVVVIAQNPIVKKDVSSSRVNLNFAEIESLPVTSVTGVIGLQAGVRSGLEIRGGDANQTAFMVNGMTLRDERDNSPFTGISYSSVDEVQIQTGGFGAQYGDIRSGLVNVVTKEPKKNKYSISLITRYSPPSQKHFGASPNDPNAYWIRPYVDPQVAWLGTNSINPQTQQPYWDDNLQNQYPEFEGWVAIANKTLANDDPSDDITAEQAQRIFLWQHRKTFDIDQPDYEIDGTVGGPIPGGEALGNLRFLASYRTTKSMYIVPLSRDALDNMTAQLKLISDISQGMKLMVQGLFSQVEGTNDNNAGLPGVFGSSSSIGNVMNQVSYIDARLFATDYWAPSTIKYYSFGGKFTHVLSPSTFYEITLNSFLSRYNTNPGTLRDTSTLYNISGVMLDQAPFGYADFPSTGINGLRMGVGFSNSRDSSKVSTYSARFDYESQLDKNNNLKAGLEFVYTENNVNYASVDKFLPSGRSRSVWSNYPIRGALYATDKLEFEGMVANLGVRVDYSDPQGDWYIYDPYTKAFASENSLNLDQLLTKQTVDKQLDISPRVGISFPITDNSKLYFNYGHFRQLPTPENLFLLRRFSDNNAVTRVANPNNPLPKTIAYELGYEQNIYDEFLIRLAGYYKDVSLQSRLVSYISRDNKVSYSRTEPNNYQDVRGFELTLTKNRGNWVQGFINYTYDVRTAGNFGFGTYYESSSEQKRYEQTTTSYYQEKPIPRPFANSSIDIFTPAEFGPKIGSFSIFGDLRLNVVTNWTSGYYFTWAGGGSIPGITNNVQWNDSWNVDLRLSKTFNFSGVSLQLFADVSNALNLKYMTQYGFVDANDYLAYMKSLHLPAEIGDPLGYGNIPGNDVPGDYRTGAFIAWDENASAAQKDEWTKNKSYIDMPNQDYFSFLNPRDIFWGLKLSVDL